DEAAGDRSRSRAAVRLQHVAIQRDRALADGAEVDAGAQRPADQPLDFLRAARLLAAGSLARRARVRCARQHAVFRREPALAAVPEEGRHAVLDARGAEYPRAAELAE